MGQFAMWNYGLIFAAFCVLMGAIGLVSADHSERRSTSGGLLLQGVLLAFVVGGLYFRNAAHMRLGALVIVAILVIQGVADRFMSDEITPSDEAPVK